MASEVDGTWQQAEVVPGAAALDPGIYADAAIDTVSCASAGNCSAGGAYADGSGHQQAFVVSEIGGAWQRAEQVPGTAALNRGAGGARTAVGATIESVSCASAGNCSAGGVYTDGSNHRQVFAVSEP